MLVLYCIFLTRKGQKKQINSITALLCAQKTYISVKKNQPLTTNPLPKVYQVPFLAEESVSSVFKFLINSI